MGSANTGGEELSHSDYIQPPSGSPCCDARRWSPMQRKSLRTPLWAVGATPEVLLRRCPETRTISSRGARSAKRAPRLEIVRVSGHRRFLMTSSPQCSPRVNDVIMQLCPPCCVTMRRVLMYFLRLWAATFSLSMEVTHFTPSWPASWHAVPANWFARAIMQSLSASSPSLWMDLNYRFPLWSVAPGPLAL